MKGEVTYVELVQLLRGAPHEHLPDFIKALEPNLARMIGARDAKEVSDHARSDARRKNED